jgi:type VI protein secretion system component VasK
MTQITTISTAAGDVTINSDLFQGYVNEAFDHLDAVAEATELFNEVVETVAETTKLKKPLVKKYLKARHEAKTKATKELGELFTALDEATSGATGSTVVLADDEQAGKYTDEA